MKKLMKKKVSLLGKEVSVFAIVVVAMIGLVSAALLPYFGLIGGEAVITQSVILEDNEVIGIWNDNFVAGSSVVDCDDDDNGHSVKNYADVEATIQLGTTCGNIAGQDDGTITETEIDWIGVTPGNNCDGIVTEIYGILELTKKDINTWQPTGNSGDVIGIIYNIVGDDFKYEVVSGEIPSGYELVYAMDKEDRFNPGNYATVKTVTEINGLNENLPMDGDWNADAVPGYCDNDNGFGDDYEHCKGAKLWIIPTSDIGNNGILSWAQMTDYYYETDLILYSNNNNNEITLPSNGGGFSFCVENEFAINLAPDTYTIGTKIVPVVV